MGLTYTGVTAKFLTPAVKVVFNYDIVSARPAAVSFAVLIH